MLEVKDLSSGYGSVPVVENLSFVVNKSEVVAIAGRNGAGKTTTLLTIAGFLRPLKGNIFFEGKEISKYSPEVIARMGIRYVRSDKKVFERFTVKENLEFACYATGDWDIDKVLEIFPALRRLLNNRAGGLSGGERQMLLVARSLIGNPKILLLDEPTEGLAAGVIKDLVSALKELKRRGLSMILVEQNLPVVFELADRFIGMKEGKIVLIEDIRKLDERKCGEVL